MANVKISALPAATSVAAADVLPIVQSATTKKATFTDVAGAVGGVRVYASAAARNSAITSPTEGMCVYLTDGDTLQVWNGTAWRTLAFATPTNGSILQVQSTTLTTIWSASVASGAGADITGLSATITPTSTTSKILVTANVHGLIDVSGSYRPYFAVQLKRGSTLVGGGTTAGSRVSVNAAGGYSAASDQNTNVSFTYLDSPATTSATTYQIAAFNPFSATYILRVNQQQSDSDTTTTMRFSSTVTVQEIAA